MSATAPPPSLEDLVPRIAPRAVFLIFAAHGVGGEDLNEVHFRAAREPKAIWRIDSGGHTGGLEAQPRACVRRVIVFFDRALLHEAAGSSLRG
jgi:hypothetical protein